MINIGSVASDLTSPNTVVYTATKGAVDAVTRVLAKELGPRKIRVNSIKPGGVETEGTQGVHPFRRSVLRAPLPPSQTLKPCPTTPYPVTSTARFASRSRRTARSGACRGRRKGAKAYPVADVDLANFIPSISLERSKSVPPTARLFKKENTFRDTVGYQLRT